MKEKVKNLMLNPAMQIKIIASFFVFMLFIKSYVDTSFILSLIDEVILTYFIINFIFLFVNKNKLGKQLKKIDRSCYFGITICNWTFNLNSNNYYYKSFII